MYESAVWASVVVTLCSALYYVSRTWVRAIQPVLATWILVETTLGLSMWMYFSDPASTWQANIGLASGFVGTGMMLVGAFVVEVRDHSVRVEFDAVQKRCLLMGALIVLFWMISENRIVSYVLVQLVAVAGYAATIDRLARASHATEPLVPWVLSFLGSMLALYPALTTGDVFSCIFLMRTIPSISLVIFLIVLTKRRSRRTIMVYE